MPHRGPDPHGARGGAGRQARDRGQRGAPEDRRLLHPLVGPQVHRLPHADRALEGHHARTGELDRQARGRAARARKSRRSRSSCRAWRAARMGDAQDGTSARRVCASPAAPTRSCGTSWRSACCGCRPSRGSTRTPRSATSRPARRRSERATRLILIDERARTLALGVDDLIDVGESGARAAASRTTRARGSRTRAATRGAGRDGARAQVRARGGAPLGGGCRVAARRARGRRAREPARRRASRSLRFVPDDDEATSRARALERAGFASLLLALARRARRERVGDHALARRRGADTQRVSRSAHETWADAARGAARADRAPRASSTRTRRAAPRASSRASRSPQSRPVQTAMLREVEGAAASGLVLLCSRADRRGQDRRRAAPVPARARCARTAASSSSPRKHLAAGARARHAAPHAARPAAARSRCRSRPRTASARSERARLRRAPLSVAGAASRERLARSGLRATRSPTRACVPAERVAAAAREHAALPVRDQPRAGAARERGGVRLQLRVRSARRPAALLRRARRARPPDRRRGAQPGRARAGLLLARARARAARGARRERCEGQPERAYGERGPRCCCEVAEHCRAQADAPRPRSASDDGPWVETAGARLLGADRGCALASRRSRRRRRRASEQPRAGRARARARGTRRPAARSAAQRARGRARVRARRRARRSGALRRPVVAGAREAPVSRPRAVARAAHPQLPRGGAHERDPRAARASTRARSASTRRARCCSTCPRPFPRENRADRRGRLGRHALPRALRARGRDRAT